MIWLLLIVCLVGGGFLVSRVYLLISRGRLDVKGVIYSRRETPVFYWITLTMAGFGALMTLLLAVVTIIALAFGRG
jgi:hypothetical protein